MTLNELIYGSVEKEFIDTAADFIEHYSKYDDLLQKYYSVITNTLTSNSINEKEMKIGEALSNKSIYLSRYSEVLYLPVHYFSEDMAQASRDENLSLIKHLLNFDNYFNNDLKRTLPNVGLNYQRKSEKLKKENYFEYEIYAITHNARLAIQLAKNSVADNEEIRSFYTNPDDCIFSTLNSLLISVHVILAIGFYYYVFKQSAKKDSGYVGRFFSDDWDGVNKPILMNISESDLKVFLRFHELGSRINNLYSFDANLLFENGRKLKKITSGLKTYSGFKECVEYFNSRFAEVRYKHTSNIGACRELRDEMEEYAKKPEINYKEWFSVTPKTLRNNIDERNKTE